MMPGGFVVGNVAVGQVLLVTPRFPPVKIIPPATAAVQAYKYTLHSKKSSLPENTIIALDLLEDCPWDA
jgi:hypothetical protein